MQLYSTEQLDELQPIDNGDSQEGILNIPNPAFPFSHYLLAIALFNTELIPNARNPEQLGPLKRLAA